MTLTDMLADHRAALVFTGIFFALLVLLRLLLPAVDRRRLVFPIVAFTLYLVGIPVRAFIVVGTGTLHDAVRVVTNLCLGLGIIAVAGLFTFDVVGRSFRRMRILRDVVSTVAALVVLVAVLSEAHVNLLSIVTTSAVLTAVIGLALQDTLGNILSGIAMQLEPTMSIGDWITVGELTGQVTEIRWRSTAIVTRNDDLVVIPNATLAKGTIVNLSRPVPWHRQWLYFDVHYRHPPNEVQRVVVAALAGIPAVKQSDPGPDCILYRMEQDHARYAVRYRLLDLRADDATNSEAMKRIWYALKRHGIEIPYPARNIFTTELNREREAAKHEEERRRRVASLRSVDLLAPLSPGDIDHLADKLRAEVYGVGERIIEQGAPGDSLYIIRRGRVSVRVMVDGMDHEIALLADGKFFGEMSLMTGEVRHATVVAVTDVECYVVDRALFHEVLSTRAALVHEVTAILAARQMQLEGSVAELGAAALRSHEERRADLASRIKRFFGLD